VKSGIDYSPITTAHEAQSDWILLALRLLKPPVHCGSNAQINNQCKNCAEQGN
jgi:hypothetical protein